MERLYQHWVLAGTAPSVILFFYCASVFFLV